MPVSCRKFRLTVCMCGSETERVCLCDSLLPRLAFVVRVTGSIARVDGVRQLWPAAGPLGQDTGRGSHRQLLAASCSKRIKTRLRPGPIDLWATRLAHPQDQTPPCTQFCIMYARTGSAGGALLSAGGEGGRGGLRCALVRSPWCSRRGGA